MVNVFLACLAVGIFFVTNVRGVGISLVRVSHVHLGIMNLLREFIAGEVSLLVV